VSVARHTYPHMVLHDERKRLREALEAARRLVEEKRGELDHAQHEAGVLERMIRELNAEIGDGG
jgi:hypothetical protein